MAVGEMGKKAIQFGKDVAYGLKGKTVGWAEGIGMREIQANMSEAQRKHIAEAGKKAGQKILDKGLGKQAAQMQTRKVEQRLTEAIGAKSTLGYQVGDFLGSGIRKTYQNSKAGLPIKQAVKGAYYKTVKDESGNLVKQLNARAVAGTAVSASMATRIASGGGLYKDRNGNTNIPGIPFL